MKRWIVVLSWLAVAACSGAQPHNADLVADIRGYSDGIRWRDFNAAALRIVPTKRVDFMDSHEELEDDMRVSDWEMRRMTYDKSRNRAEVHMEWTWFLDSRGIVHTTVTRQLWTRRGKRWIIEREHRLRGEPMPGVAEPKKPRKRRKTAEPAPLSAAETGS